MEKYLLSIDNGLTTTKSVIFTLDGKEIASSLISTVIENKGEYAEIDMELQWKNTAHVIKQAIIKSGINPSDIIGIGNSGHGAGLYSLDSDNKPVRKAVTSMDSRANAVIDQWNKDGKSPYDKLCQNFWSGQAIPVLYWLKCNEPQNYNRIDKILMVKDWIIFRLTGETGLDYTDASNSGLINPVSRTVDKDILNRFGVGEIYEKIPAVRQTTAIAGYVTKKAAEETGLMEGIPVMGGVFDCIACALGSGVLDTDKYSLIAGTWNVNAGVEEKLINKSETIKCSLYADIEKYFYVESSATSAVNLEWFVDNVIKGLVPMEISNRDLFALIDKGVKGINLWDSNIIYLPFLFKSHLANGTDGCFWGIKPEDTIFHMLRAIFEGVAFAHLMHIENLKAGGIVRNKAVLSGGASNSEIWCQIFADVLNMEVAITEVSQAGALGTAICTAVAIGWYKDFDTAVAAMVKEKRIYTPDRKNNELYLKKYKEFKRIINKFNQE